MKMKKRTSFGICILSIIILCSLSYQPIIAEKQVIQLKEEVEYVEDEDCGCISDNDNWVPPVLCLIIIIRLAMLKIFLGFTIGNPDFWLYDYWDNKVFELQDLYSELNCNDLLVP